MKKKSIFLENGFKLSDEKMKTIVGGNVPPGGNCVFTGTPCGPNGGCVSHWSDIECCCSIDGHDLDCCIGG